MKVQRRRRMFTLIELAATLEEMSEQLSVWVAGVGEPYRWGSMKEFREEAAEMLAYPHPAYPALMQIEGRLYPIAGIDIHGNRIVFQALPPLSTPNMSRRREAPLPA